MATGAETPGPERHALANSFIVWICKISIPRWYNLLRLFFAYEGSAKEKNRMRVKSHFEFTLYINPKDQHSRQCPLVVLRRKIVYKSNMQIFQLHHQVVERRIATRKYLTWSPFPYQKKNSANSDQNITPPLLHNILSPENSSVNSWDYSNFDSQRVGWRQKSMSWDCLACNERVPGKAASMVIS